MNRLSREQRVQIISLLSEGMAIRGVSRVTGISKTTILKFLPEIGLACSEYQRKNLKRLPTRRIQLDEQWQFVFCKERTLPECERGKLGKGDCWLWSAIDADTRLVITWALGPRDGFTCRTLLLSLYEAVHGDLVQISTDALRYYATNIRKFFGNADVARIEKIFSTASKGEERRYSPAKIVGTNKQAVQGEPDFEHVSTSYVERKNLTMRLWNRRFTRLTNAYSRNIINHAAAVSLHMMIYNFCRPHASLNKHTPAMAAGVTDHVWTIDEVVALVADKEPRAKSIWSLKRQPNVNLTAGLESSGEIQTGP